MKVALAHDWLFHMRGGEKVLENIARLFPDAIIYTLFLDKENLSPYLQSRQIVASRYNTPFFKKNYQQLLPLLPTFVKDIRIPDDVDLLITCSSCVINGVKRSDQTIHVSHIFSPMRYVTDECFDDYFPGGVKRIVGKALKYPLRFWDKSTAQRVQYFISNSDYIAKRIKKYYGRNATTIHSPVEFHLFQVNPIKENFYLTVGALTPYKRVDIAVDAFNEMPDKKLLVVGKGSEYESLRKKAKSNIQFLGFLPTEQIRDLYGKAKGFIFPGIEDFGITPLEAMASGTPVIAFQDGGVMETVTSETGVFFKKQTAQSLREAVAHFETLKFDPFVCRSRAELFKEEVFRDKVSKFLESTLNCRISEKCEK